MCTPSYEGASDDAGYISGATLLYPCGSDGKPVSAVWVILLRRSPVL